MEKKLRKIQIAKIQDGLKRIQAYLFANMIDNELAVDDSQAAKPTYFIKLVWLDLDAENGKKVGCPCFACDFEGILPYEGKQVKGIVYAKVFADKDYNMVKMFVLEEGVNYGVEEIVEGETFFMKDSEGRYEDETFVLQQGIITKIA